MPDPDPPPIEPPDAPSSGTSLTLLDRVRASDGDAWRRAYDLYFPLVVHWCRGRGVREGDAEDVAQEVFRSVASAIGSFRRDRPGDTFRGWLRAVTFRKAADWFRERGSQPAEAAGGTEAGFVLRDVAAEDEEDDPAQLNDLHRRALDHVRGEFEGTTWRAFWRIAIDGLAADVVAREIGISTAAARQAKWRVLRRLREELGDLIA